MVPKTDSTNTPSLVGCECARACVCVGWGGGGAGSNLEYHSAPFVCQPGLFVRYYITFRPA
ncbi:hypothetical protein Hanom_Chr02g00143381 [Helianthus anomalus]